MEKPIWISKEERAKRALENRIAQVKQQKQQQLTTAVAEISEESLLSKEERDQIRMRYMGQERVKKIRKTTEGSKKFVFGIVFLKIMI
jgi:Mn-dependent DtxR family transcriptional regulator